jgi:predicted metal-binding protein
LREEAVRLLNRLEELVASLRLDINLCDNQLEEYDREEASCAAEPVEESECIAKCRRKRKVALGKRHHLTHEVERLQCILTESTEKLRSHFIVSLPVPEIL